MTKGIDPLLRFRVGSHDKVLAFAAQSPRLADLARTHPLLFIALATDYGYEGTRHAAINAALAGRRLRDVCELKAIPHCLRSIPMEICPVPLPPAHWSRDASQTLAQFMPDDPISLGNWVHSIFFVNGAADEAFATWLANRHELFSDTFFDHRRLLPIVLHYWFGQNREYELHRLMPGRWTVRAGLKRVLIATRSWLYRIACRSYLPERVVGNQEVPVTIGPFQAFELTNYRALLAEQQAMDNCLDRYARRIASGSFAIFSLRTPAGDRVANFEVGLREPDGPMVIEIKGRSNATVTADVFEPVLQWVSRAPQLLRRPVEPMQRMIDADEVFADLIKPYVLSHQFAIGHLAPLTLRGLEDDLEVLSKRIGITGWPVRYEGTYLI